MLVVLKIMYSFAPDSFWNAADPTTQARELRNPFMAHAWLDLSAARPEHLDDFVNRVWGTTLSNVDRNQLTFANIVSSDIMMNTLWSDEDCRPFLTPQWRLTGELTWSDAQGDDIPSPVRDLISEKYPEANPSVFGLVASPGMDLGAQVASRFGGFASPQYEVSLRPSRSLFLCATFDVSDVRDGKHLHFDDVSTFELEVVESTVRNGRTVQDKRGLIYNLVTIVFHRDHAADMDTVRAYGILGGPLLPVEPGCAYGRPSVLVSELWNNSSFFAVYARSDLARASNFTEKCEENADVSAISALERNLQNEFTTMLNGIGR